MTVYSPQILKLYTVHFQNGRSRSKLKNRAMHVGYLQVLDQIRDELQDPGTVYSKDVARVDVLEQAEGRQLTILKSL